jgi:hypothetical protein
MIKEKFNSFGPSMNRGEPIVERMRTLELNKDMTENIPWVPTIFFAKYINLMRFS